MRRRTVLPDRDGDLTQMVDLLAERILSLMEREREIASERRGIR
jgi:hypothetical protein